MTVTAVNSTNPRVEYVATAGQTVFDYDWPIFAEEDLEVYLNEDGLQPEAADILTLNTDYTVQDEATNGGGTITLLSAASAGDRLVIRHVPTLQRQTNFTNGGPFRAPDQNDELNKIWMAIKRLEALKLDRSQEDSPAMDGDLSMAMFGIQNLADPAAGTDAVNRDYVLGQIGSIGDLTTPTVSSVAQLRLLTPTSYALVTGYSEKGDGGGGLFYFDSDDTSTADDGGAVIVGVGGARWKSVERDRINVLSYGADRTNTSDSAPAFTAAIARAKLNNGTVYIPAGQYRVDSTVIVLGGVNIEGDGAQNFTTSTHVGTLVNNNAAAANPAFLFGVSGGSADNVRGIRASNIKVVGDGTNDGFAWASNTNGMQMVNLAAQSCRYGFHNRGSWTQQCIGLFAASCTEGFRFEGDMTNSNWIGCVAFNCTGYGFRITFQLTYNTFQACATDGCATGVSIEGAVRGLSFYSLGIEGATTAGIVIDNVAASVDIHDLNFADHSGEVINMVDVQAGDVTIIGWSQPSAFGPAVGGKQINVVTDNRVTLISPRLFGSTIGDIDRCTVLGAGGSTAVDRHAKKVQVAGGASTVAVSTGVLAATTGTSATLWTMPAHGAYLAFATNNSGTQNAIAVITSNGAGTAVTMNNLTTAFCEFEFNGNDVRLLNTSGSTQTYRVQAIRIA